MLSTLLCSFFYGDLERRYLQFTARADGVRSFWFGRVVCGLMRCADVVAADRRLFVCDDELCGCEAVFGRHEERYVVGLS